MTIIEKIRLAKLKGRGGAGFDTADKWEMVKNAPGSKKYIICNVSEGEPAVFKDGLILENYASVVIEGIKIALSEIKGSEAFIYLRKDYYDRLHSKLEKMCEGQKINLFREPCGYLGGEETALLETIEGRRTEPRNKPPYPTQKGLWQCPTLINNLETFYYVAMIAKDAYKNTRFYCFWGDCDRRDVFEFPEDWSIKRLLEESKNYPEFDFFVQIGGGASGEFLAKEELDRPLRGAGSIIVYNKAKTDPRKLAKRIADFYFLENCGKCAPCREGIYRLRELFKKKDFDAETALEITVLLREASFCALGKGAANSLEGLINKIWMKKEKK